MRAVAAEQGRINESARQMLIGFSEGKEVRSEDWAACGDAAKKVLGRLDGYVNIGVASADGHLLCSALQPPPGKDMQRPGFLKGLTEAQHLLIGQYHVGLITGQQVLTVAVKPDQRSAMEPLLAWANLDLQWLARHYDESFDARNQTLLITDRNGTILVRLPENSRWVGKPIGAPYMPLVNATAEGVLDIAGVSQRLRISKEPGFRPSGLTWLIKDEHFGLPTRQGRHLSSARPWKRGRGCSITLRLIRAPQLSGSTTFRS